MQWNIRIHNVLIEGLACADLARNNFFITRKMLITDRVLSKIHIYQWNFVLTDGLLSVIELLNFLVVCFLQ